MDLCLQDKVVFVTGASGGIGEALTAAFVAEGARVAACSRRGVPAGERVLPLTADVGSPDELDAAMRAAAAAFGRVDVCVANAGVWPPEPLPLDAMPEARVREVIETDLLGAAWTARAFVAALRRSGPRPDGHGASLVFIGSTAGRFGEPGHAEYAAAKAALRGLTLSLKNEIVHADPWARVNLIDPGWTVTTMAEKTLAASGQLDRVTLTMPLRRVAHPADVAAAVLFFASPAMARHVSGEALTVAGGMEGRVLW
jgi:3-oxoacyl-[acyl-carrier protein] reductase